MKSPAFFLFVLCLMGSPATGWGAATPWRSNVHGQVRLISPYRVAPRRGVIYFGLEFKTQRGWHVYWRNPGDSGYPPRLRWDGSLGFRNPQQLYPAPHYYDLPGDLIAIGYSGETVYPIQAQATGVGDRIHAVVDVDYLTCGDSCVPYRYQFTLDIPTGPEEQLDPEINRLITRYKALLPTSPAIPLHPALYRKGNSLYFKVDLPASAHASPRRVELFVDTHPDLSFRRSQAAAKGDGSLEVRIPVQLKDGRVLPRLTRLSFTLNGLGSIFKPQAIEQTGEYPVQTAPPAEEAIPGMGLPSAPAAPESSLRWMVLLGLLGGLILNIMPCVLPVLSIKLFGLLQHSGEDRRIIARDALASAAGIVVSFIIGGGIAILAKAAGAAVGWGVQFQDPRFVALLAVIVTFFALNLWGVFEITLPPALAHLGAVSREDEGAASYFVSGMFATLLATPCSAPFLGTAMGFALSQSTGMTLAIFSAAGIGMAIPYLCLAVFPHALHWLPKPGVWMLHVRVVLGFFLAATVVWLGYVLAAQVDAVGLTYFYLGLLSIGFLSWLKELLITSRARGSRPLRWTIWALMAVLVLGMMHSVEAHRQSSPASSASGGGLLAWRAFDTQEIARELRAGHSVFVDVTADWCFTCKVNEKTVLETAPIVRALQERGVVLMRADWTNRNPVIGDFLKSFNRYGIPFYVFYKPGQKPIVLSEFLTKGKVLKALGL